jgi:hypothetical protein
MCNWLDFYTIILYQHSRKKKPLHINKRQFALQIIIIIKLFKNNYSVDLQTTKKSTKQVKKINNLETCNEHTHTKGMNLFYANNLTFVSFKDC